MIYLLCGITASGKSTYVANHAADDDIVISRDEIRFSMLQEGQQYFDNEKQVITEFFRQIREAADAVQDVYIDATHITKKARKKVLKQLCNRNVTCICFKPNYERSVQLNKGRKGLALVSTSAIFKQYSIFEEPTIDEGFKEIIYVEYY